MVVSHDDATSAAWEGRGVRDTATVKRARLRMACSVSVQRSHEERVTHAVRDIRPRNRSRSSDLESDIAG
jgi:hypothetical protein